MKAIKKSKQTPPQLNHFNRLQKLHLAYKFTNFSTSKVKTAQRIEMESNPKMVWPPNKWNV